MGRKVRCGQVASTALEYLTTQINKQLKGRVTLQYKWNPGEDQLPSLCPKPKDLQTALWVQFADAVQNNTEFRRCRVCNKWLAIARGEHRTNRGFCSSACRSKLYRQRQDQARQLFADGKSMEDIATELESDLATVRRWITGRKDA